MALALHRGGARRVRRPRSPRSTAPRSRAPRAATCSGSASARVSGAVPADSRRPPSPAARRRGGRAPAPGRQRASGCPGDWMMPAMSAPSPTVRLVRSLREEGAGRDGHAVQRERPAVAEVDLVQIELEDLFLGGLGLEHDRHELLEQLAPDRTAPRLLFLGHLLGEEEVAGELLRDGAGAHQVGALAAQVGHERPRPCGSGRCPDARRSGGLRWPARPAARAPGMALSGTRRRRSRAGVASALSSGGSSATPRTGRSSDEDAGDGRRAGRGADRGAARRARLGRPLEAHVTSGVGAAARHDLHGVAADGELARLAGRVAAGVAEVVQPLHHVGARQREARAERERPAVDARNDADAFALQALVDESGEAAVVVAGGAGGGEDRQRDERRRAARVQRPPRKPRRPRRAGGSDGEHPVVAVVDRQQVDQPVDGGRAVAVEQPHRADLTFLRLAVGKELLPGRG